MLFPLFSKNNECTANIDCSWALDILDDFSKFHSAHFTLKYQKFGKKWRKFFLHWTLLLVLREGPTYSANLSIRNHMLCLIKIGPQNMGPTYWESPKDRRLCIRCESSIFGSKSEDEDQRHHKYYFMTTSTTKWAIERRPKC